eukprot:CAMPEP_0172359642 /NCGR_PEP_ID=MMETSP1060-20121228/3832_1 /TAXON_ID=37318 /ORGANISM="Pseudo-nitzschia pungens, Strain cf. cingulata" /LENGTH=467 /DNA_ID=CAMNT_0013081403 /DNA_START=83 /DNA_END=1486 /DNA_ORIENTATION=-
MTMNQTEVDQEIGSIVEDDGVAYRMGLLMQLFPRCIGAVSFSCVLYVFYFAWKKRHLLFHRLVLGMSFYGLVFALCFLIGPLAIPSDEIEDFGGYEGFSGNYGTVGTCTAQGFLLYLSIRVGIMYYCSLSVYSYLGVLNNFQQEKYIWCEKWIHILVHVFPVVFSHHFLVNEDFNPSEMGYCKQSSHPFNCGRIDLGDTPCERGSGPFGIKEVLVFWFIPNFFFLVFPTSVMIALYLRVSKRQVQRGSIIKSSSSNDNNQQQGQASQVVTEQGAGVLMPAKTVAVQSCGYLFALYLVSIPIMAMQLLSFILSVDTIKPLLMFVQVNGSLFFLWTTLMYRHFGVPPSSSNNHSRESMENESTLNTDSEFSDKKSSKRSKATEFIFYNPEESSTVTPIAEDSTVPKTKTTATPEPAPSRPHAERRYSFNIFDGTNASTQMSEFVFAGDSDDEEADKHESIHWHSVQNHL